MSEPKSFCSTCGNYHRTDRHMYCEINEAAGLYADGQDEADNVWTVMAMLPRGKYRVVERDDGWYVLSIHEEGFT